MLSRPYRVFDGARVTGAPRKHGTRACAPIGLIAGAGRFPILFAEKARQLSLPLVCVGLRGLAAPELSELSNRFYWFGITRIGGIIRCFKRERVERVVLAGKLHKIAMHTPFR